jgi:hypothetical protein
MARRHASPVDIQQRPNAMKHASHYRNNFEGAKSLSEVLSLHYCTNESDTTLTGHAFLSRTSLHLLAALYSAHNGSKFNERSTYPSFAPCCVFRWTTKIAGRVAGLGRQSLASCDALCRQTVRRSANTPQGYLVRCGVYAYRTLVAQQVLVSASSNSSPQEFDTLTVRS